MLNSKKARDLYPFQGSLCSNPGQRFEEVRQLYVNDEGIDVLVTTGQIDVVVKINSYRDSVDLGLLLQRFKATGDDSFLNCTKGFYADVSDIPTNLVDLKNYLRKVEHNFNELPLDIRDKFGHNMFKFMNAQKEDFDFLNLDPNVSDSIDSDGGVTNEE